MPKISPAEIEFCILSLWKSLSPLRDPFRADQTPGPEQDFEPDSVDQMYHDMYNYHLNTEADINAHEEPVPTANFCAPRDLDIIYSVFTEGACRCKYDNIGSTFKRCKYETECYPWEAKDNDHKGFHWAVAFAVAALELEDVFVDNSIKSPRDRLLKAKEGVQQKLGRRNFELD